MVRKWDTYFGPEKERYYAEKSIPDLENLLVLREFSRAAQSGSLLQYAKQGISLVHNGPTSCPAGRAIGSDTLKDIIWQGRNQSMHWDESRFNTAVQNCFQALAINVDPKFSQLTTRSLAFDIVELLGWKEFADFERDMLSLA